MSTLRRVLRAVEPHPGEHFKDKIIAVGLAFLVWFAVNTERTIPADLPAVPVRLINLPEDLAFAEPAQDTVTVSISATERDIGRVRATPGLLSPAIDLSDLRPGEHLIPVSEANMNLPGGVSVTGVEPGQIRILLEPRERKFVEVSPVVSGEPAPGFEVVGRATDPESVEVSGPRSVLEQLERINTATVDVSGNTESFSQRVALSEVDLVQLVGQSTVELRIEITEQAITDQFDGVPVVVINNRFQVAVNPQQLGVALSGPPSILSQLDATQMELVIDAAELEPQEEDYRIEPVVRFADPALGERVQVVALFPQRVIDVHVYQQPARH